MEHTNIELRVGILASVGIHLDAFFTDIIDEWRRAGIEVFPAAGTSSSIAGHEVLDGVTQSPSPKNLRALKSLKDWSERNDLDLVITNTATVSALVRLAKLSPPVVYFCHGFHWNTGRKPMEHFWRAVESFFARKTDLLLTLNTDDYAWARKLGLYGRTEYLRGGVGVPRYWYEGAYDLSGLESYYVWVGNLTERKRPNLLLDVVEDLRKENRSISVKMAGDGPLRQDIERDILRRGLGQNITLIGHTNDLLGLIDDSSGLIHTAAWEGLPRALLEATVRRRPTYAFDVKGVRDIPGVVLAREGFPTELSAKVRADVNVSAKNDRMRVASQQVDGSEDVATRIMSHFMDIIEDTRT